MCLLCPISLRSNFGRFWPSVTGKNPVPYDLFNEPQTPVKTICIQCISSARAERSKQAIQGRSALKNRTAGRADLERQSAKFTRALSCGCPVWTGIRFARRPYRVATRRLFGARLSQPPSPPLGIAVRSHPPRPLFIGEWGGCDEDLA